MLTYKASRPHHPVLSVPNLQVLRDRLAEEAQAQSAQLRAHEAAAVQLRGLHDADSALERELAEAGAQRARKALGEIGHALERLDAGTFGTCEACGVPVPFERLQAVPSARVCVACPRRAAWC